MHVTTSEKFDLHFNSPSLHELFDIPITPEFLPESFGKNILDDIKYNEVLRKIRSLSSNVTCFWDVSNDRREPGTVYVFDVNVKLLEGKLTVCERVSIKLIYLNLRRGWIVVTILDYIDLLKMKRSVLYCDIAK